MERKTKHRLMGILVIIGLVFIFLPFLQDTKSTMPETAAATAPPFPDQIVQLSSDEIDDAQDTVTGQLLSPPAKPVVQSVQSTDVSPAAMQSEELIDTSEDSINPLQPEALNPNEQVILQPVASTPKTTKQPTVAHDLVPLIDSQMNAAAHGKHVTAKPKKAVHQVKRVTIPVKMKLARTSFAPVDNNGLFKLKSAVWVIQIGSFNNKANALRLVNKLRAKGYPAFIQQVASNTRVFVGPENKQSNARLLANQLKSELKISGVVISYKPLTL